MKNTTMKILIGLFAITMLVSCENTSQISMENYKKISNGMTLSQVESIIGKGKTQAESTVANFKTEVITWESGTKVVSVTFQNGKVVGKAQAGL